MTSETFKKAIIDQRKELDTFFATQKIIDRDIDKQKLLGFLRQPNVLAITGPRRCGKSISSVMILSGLKYGYVNFGDERFTDLATEDLNNILQIFYELYGTDLEYFIFDEIQNVPGWQLFINRLRLNKKIIITGSNANLLSGELATHLTGRHINFTLYPFSFKEFLRWREYKIPLSSESLSTADIANLRNYLADYLQTGGFPEALSIGPAMARNIYSDIIEKDILFRHNIRYKKMFKEFSHYLVSSFGQPLSYNKLRQPFGIKNQLTIKNYFSYLSDSFLVFAVEKFSFKLKQQIIALRKIYAIDTGIIKNVSFQFSENYGHLMENLVFLELLRQKSYQDDGLEIYYWQDPNRREVDFVLKKGAKVVQLIQVCKDPSEMFVKEREVKSLLLAAKDLRCDNLLIIADEIVEKKYFNKQNIQIKSLWSWLLFS